MDEEELLAVKKIVLVFEAEPVLFAHITINQGKITALLINIDEHSGTVNHDSIIPNIIIIKKHLARQANLAFAPLPLIERREAIIALCAKQELALESLQRYYQLCLIPCASRPQPLRATVNTLPTTAYSQDKQNSAANLRR